MEIIQNDQIKEKVYIDILDNGMKIIIIPKENTEKKYIIWGTKFGSIDNHFIEPKTGKEIRQAVKHPVQIAFEKNLKFLNKETYDIKFFQSLFR